MWPLGALREEKGASAPSASATLAQAFRTEASAQGKELTEARGPLALRLSIMGFSGESVANLREHPSSRYVGRPESRWQHWQVSVRPPSWASRTSQPRAHVVEAQRDASGFSYTAGT